MADTLRTRVLDDRMHNKAVWCSDWSRTLYRHHGGTWQYFQDGEWHRAYNETRDATYTLIGTYGEMFIRIAERVK